MTTSHPVNRKGGIVFTFLSAKGNKSNRLKTSGSDLKILLYVKFSGVSKREGSFRAERTRCANLEATLCTKEIFNSVESLIHEKNFGGIFNSRKKFQWKLLLHTVDLTPRRHRIWKPKRRGKFYFFLSKGYTRQ